MSNENNDTSEGRWVQALVLASPTTPQQRHRNFAFYERIRDGVPGDHRQGGLGQFVFEVPVSACTVGGKPPHFTFRLDPESDCYRRLVRYVVGHCAERCDADEEVERLRALVFYASGMVDDAVLYRDDRDEWHEAAAEIRKEAGGSLPSADREALAHALVIVTAADGGDVANEPIRQRARQVLARLSARVDTKEAK